MALLLPLWLRAAQHILAHSAQAPAATGAGCRCHRWADMSPEGTWHPQRLLRLLLQVLQKRTQHLASLQGDSGHFQQRVKPRTLEDLEAPCLAVPPLPVLCTVSRPGLMLKFNSRHRQQAFTPVSHWASCAPKVRSSLQLRQTLKELTAGATSPSFKE